MHRRMVSVWAAVVITMTAVAPATGQSLGDTFNQLRSTLRQLGGGKAKGSPAATPTPAAGPAGVTGAGGDQAAMVPASVVLDDPSDTALEKVPVVARRVETFEVRGFRLGMSPREVGRIAARERFRRRWNSILQTTGTFELEATRLANQKLNRPIATSSEVQLGRVQAFDPDGDEINLEFTLEPAGPRLSRLTYNARLNGTTPEQAGAALAAKYGRQTEGRPGVGRMAWRNSAQAYDLASPGLGVEIDEDSLMFFLEQSVDYGREARRRLAARAAELAAAQGGGLRF